MKMDLWYRWLHRICCWLYFSKISLIHPERLPAKGPTLYIGLHRNGAVDGFIYHGIIPQAVFLISSQLRRNWFSRIFFDGIAVTRAKDVEPGDVPARERQTERSPSDNSEALRNCLQLLRSGGELFIFPEGTSSLGPRHLPFKSGATKVLVDFLAEDRPINVIPIGIQYECAWGFRSKVEVVIGEPISTALSPLLTPLGRFKTLKRRMETALEDVGVNVESEADQTMIQRLAYVATLGTSHSYFETLKTLEKGVPEKILSAWETLQPDLKRRKLLRHQGVPLFPTDSITWYAAALAVCAPIVFAAALVNAPPLLAAWWAGKRLADDRNVISLWRILAGTPLFLLWAALLTSVGICGGQMYLSAAYLALTWIGLKSFYRVKKLAVAVHNGWRCPQLRERVIAFRKTVLEELPE